MIKWIIISSIFVPCTAKNALQECTLRSTGKYDKIFYIHPEYDWLNYWISLKNLTAVSNFRFSS